MLVKHFQRKFPLSPSPSHPLFETVTLINEFQRFVIRKNVIRKVPKNLGSSYNAYLRLIIILLYQIIFNLDFDRTEKIMKLQMGSRKPNF
jgi:hypothetical protein